ncbi:MAG: glycosyltransferase [Desulfobulbus sp.]|nr:glycosyltransferase [Desulfobulbus sp.]
MEKKVSVIIPMYNSSEYIVTTIDSVINQDYTNLEIIIIDDGSTDDSYDKVKVNFDGLVNIIKIKNSGVSFARNIGINASSGHYIAFLDADDLWDFDKISKQVCFMEKNQEYGVSYTGRYIINNNRIIFEKKECYSGYILNKILVRNFVCLSSVLIKRECFFECGYFDESLIVSEDYDLWIRIASKYKFIYLEEKLVYYRITPGSLSKKFNKMIVGAYSVFVKNTIEVNVAVNINFSTYILFFSDTFKTTGHYFYDLKKYKIAMSYFLLSFLLFPFRIETCAMLMRSFLKK